MIITNDFYHISINMQYEIQHKIHYLQYLSDKKGHTTPFVMCPFLNYILSEIYLPSNDFSLSSIPKV